MPLIDKICMGPVEKYYKYGRFPYKMVAHFLLALALVAQIFLVVNFNSSYSIAVKRKLLTLFFDGEMEQEGYLTFRERYFFSVADVREQVNFMIDNFFEIPESDSIEEYQLSEELDDDGIKRIAHVTMSPFFIRKEDRIPWAFLEMNLTNDERGAFHIEEDGTPRLPDDQLRDFFAAMSHFTLTLLVRHNIPTTKFTTYDCYRWIVRADFRMINNGHYAQFNRMDRQFCQNVPEGYIQTNFLTRYLWVLIITCIFTILNLYLNIKYIKDITNSIERVRKELNKDYEKKHKKKLTINDINRRNATDSQEIGLDDIHNGNGSGDESLDEEDMRFNWSDLTLTDRRELYSGWSFIIILGNIVTLIACAFLLASTSTSQRQGEIMLGFGSFLVVISLIKYYDNAKVYNIVWNTAVKSASIFFKATIGALPIFKIKILMNELG